MMSIPSAPSIQKTDALLGALQRKESWFEKAAATAYQAVLAISQNDEVTARNEIDKLRLLRSILSVGESNEAVASGVEGASPLSLQRMRCAVDAIQASQDVIFQWIQANAAKLSEAHELDSLSWQRMIDRVLPVAWNFDADVLLVYGRAPGALVAALHERGQRRVLFILHADDVGAGDHVAITEEMRVVRTESDVCSYVEGLKTPYPKHLARMDIDQCDSLQPEDFGALIHKLIMTTWMSVNTDRMFARNWVQQGVGNIPLVATQHNLSELDGVFNGRPAVLIAPGPSLEKNIHQLRAIKGKAVLIAPLQTLRRLYLANVQPDFVVVLDPQDQTTEEYDFFRDVPDDFLPPLIAAVNCHPSVIKKFKQAYFYSSGGPVDHWIETSLSQPLVRLHAGSVALIGLLLAIHWQCNPIVLTGQDLALKDGQQYAADSNLKLDSQCHLFSLPGYYGGTVQSPYYYWIFHHHFERIGAEMAKRASHIQLFNCTEGGAFIRGFEHLPLRQVTDSHMNSEFPKASIVGLSLTSAAVTAQLLRANAARDHLHRTLVAIDAARKQAALCKRMTLRASAGAKFLRKLAIEEQRMREFTKQVEGFSIIYQSEIDLALKESAEATSLKSNLEASRKLYAVVDAGCVYLRPLVVSALGILAVVGDGLCAIKSPAELCA